MLHEPVNWNRRSHPRRRRCRPFPLIWTQKQITHTAPHISLFLLEKKKKNTLMPAPPSLLVCKQTPFP